MSPEQTIEKLKAMKMSAMAEAYEQQLANPERYRDLSFDDRFAMAVDNESDTRKTKKIERLISGSNMYFKSACPEQINYDPHRGIDKSNMARLLEGSYIAKNQISSSKAQARLVRRGCRAL